ncbi:flagellar export protein FliJ [Paenibacillus gansuensis]|uniref:Flagellar FliJ protein n=1 Tax=Paenibacillus gansuensis TaxID=306542 RepID=A0ABW5PDT4_9BACL
MRFHYHLQKIVDLKTTQKTHAEWMLSKAVGVLREEESSLTMLYEQKTKLQEELQEQSLSTTISSMRTAQFYISRLDERIRNQQGQIQAAQSEVEHTKNVLQNKMQDEKVWSMTREKAKLMFHSQLLKKEQDELDEMATVRFVNTAL